MKNADKWVQPTNFTGNYPDWNGYTWLDWSPEAKCYHPGDDYNFGFGDNDLGQAVVATAAGKVFHTSKSTTGYGNLVIIKHTLGYNLKRFIKETYGIETDELYSLYAHLKDILVSVGNEIDEGALIAHVGKTGTKWAHLHFEVYSLWKDLKNTAYRFYPVGWSKEQIAENWLPAYKFIESTKNTESYETFLGKPKAYWVQVEKDREKLLVDSGKCDDKILTVKVEMQEIIDEKQKEVEQLTNESARLQEITEKAQNREKGLIEGFTAQINLLKNDKRGLEIRITEILSEQSEKYKVGEAVMLLIETIKKVFRKGGEQKNGQSN